MRAGAALAGVAAVAGAAAAAPAKETELPAAHCHVTITEAPEPVAGTIQQWANGELHCKTSLVVRVFPVANGLAIIATDEAGGVRQRVVPDADAAGVLVASWIADDAPPLTSPPATGALVVPGVSPGTPAVAAHAPSKPSTSAVLGVDTRLVNGQMGYSRQAFELRSWLEIGRKRGWSFMIAAEGGRAAQGGGYLLASYAGAMHVNEGRHGYVRERFAFGIEHFWIGADNADYDVNETWLPIEVEVAAGVKVSPRVGIELGLSAQVNIDTSLETLVAIAVGTRVTL